MQTDTLTYNAQQIAEWQESGDYDYNRELVGSQMNLLEWIMRKIEEFMDELFSGISSDTKYTLYVIAALLLLFFIIFVVVKLKPKLFRREEKSELEYKEVEDTIYGIDFDEVIRQMVEQANWRQAVRLVYLQTLLYLQNAERIDWQPSKTPVQYMRQVNHPAFTTMTHHFINVRYGNFEATKELFDEMKTLQSALSPLTSQPAPLNSHD